jgi:hypothetical protein
MKSEYTVSDGNDGQEPEPCYIKDVSAEHQPLVNSMLSRLTRESQFVLYAIFNTPGELSSVLFSGKVTKKNVKDYLHFLGWSDRIINKTVMEIRRFTSDLLT